MRICFIGESFVNGYGDPDYQGWPGKVCASALQRGHDVTCYNLGIRRNTSSDVALRWRDETLRRLPHGDDGRVIFSYGANDTVIESGMLRVENGASLTNCRNILSEAGSLFPVLMISPPPVENAEHSQRIRRLSAQFQDLCREIGVPYLDVFTPLSVSSHWAAEVAAYDGAHPRAGGYAELAALVEQWSSWKEWLP